MSHCMMCLFADATPSANMVWLVILSIGTLAGNIAMVGQWLSMRKKQDISPQPLMIALEKEFATKHELEKLASSNAQDHRDIFSKIGGVDRGSAQKLSTEVSAVHTRINSLEKSVGGLEAATELQNQRLAQMDGKLDRLMERKYS